MTVGNVDGLVLHFLADLALGHRVTPELAREHHQRAIEQAALLQIADQLRDRRVDQLLHRVGARVPVLVLSQFTNGMYSDVTST